MQLPQQAFLIEVERSHRWPEPLAFAGIVGSTQQCLKTDYLLPEMAVSLHALPLLLSQPPTSLPTSSIAFAAKP